MSESLEQAMRQVRQAALALVQDRAAQTLQTLKEHFAHFVGVSLEERPAWVALHCADLFWQTGQAHNAYMALLDSCCVDIGDGVMAVNAEHAESFHVAQQAEQSTKVVYAVLSLFECYYASDFQAKAEIVNDIFGWLHDVICQDAIPEVVEARSQTVQLLAKERAQLSVTQLQAELTALSQSSLRARKADVILADATALFEKALIAHTFYQTLVVADVEPGSPTNSAAYLEAAQIHAMCYVLGTLNGLFDNAYLYEPKEMSANKEVLRELFKKMRDLLTTATAYVPELEASHEHGQVVFDDAASQDDEPLGDNVFRLGDRRRKPTMH